MTISLETMLRHMKWANQEIYFKISELPDEALASYVTKSEWHLAEILSHLVGSADGYARRIAGRP